MHTQTSTTAGDIPPAGTVVTVTQPDGYQVTGQMIGLTLDGSTSKLRVLSRDGLEVWIPAAAVTVTVDA